MNEYRARVKVSPIPWSDQRFFIGTLTVMALAVYAIGFRAASFSWFNAVGAASAHVLPGALVGTAAWRAQGWFRKASLPRWLLHPLGAICAGLSWLGLMLAFTYLARPEIIAKVARAASMSTVVSGIMLYAAIALIHAIVTSRQRAAESDAARARAELMAIRARVEPHFLYNTLETISGLVRHDPEAAETAIGRLGRLLRRVLETPEGHEADNLVALAEELAVVRDYLAIEQLRFGERLQVIEVVDEQVLDDGIPALTLQTLVENAVTHGVAQRSAPATVSISACREGDTLVLVVSDDGAGAEERKILDGGLGLKLLRKRLEAHFAGHATFNVASSPGHGASIRIAIPSVSLE